MGTPNKTSVRAVFMWVIGSWMVNIKVFKKGNGLDIKTPRMLQWDIYWSGDHYHWVSIASFPGSSVSECEH